MFAFIVKADDLGAVPKMFTVKSKPLEEILKERGKARSDLAKRDTVAKDPIAAAFGYDESRLPGGDFLLSGRSSAVLAGDLGASLIAANYFQNNIALKNHLCLSYHSQIYGYSRQKDFLHLNNPVKCFLNIHLQSFAQIFY